MGSTIRFKEAEASQEDLPSRPATADPLLCFRRWCTVALAFCVGSNGNWDLQTLYHCVQARVSRQLGSVMVDIVFVVSGSPLRDQRTG